MSVNNLENPEQGMNLTDRDPKGTEKVKADIGRVKKGGLSAESELEGMRRRIEEARKLTDGRPERNGRLSDFERGRDAAIRTIEG